MPPLSSSKFVADAEAFLGEVFLPDVRAAQLAELRSCLLGPLADARPVHVWVHGPPGVGKTAALHHVLEEVSQASRLSVYVDTSHRFTLLDLVEQIIQPEDRIPLPQRTRQQQVDLLRASLHQRPCVIALDHVHTLRRGDLADLLRHLLAIPRASLLCAADRGVAALKLPSDVVSRLTPRQLEFPRFDQPALVEIARLVATQALHPGTWADDLLHVVAEQARGDARRALALLRHAVQRAIDGSAESVAPEHLTPANYDHYSARAEDELSTLSSHHRILYDLIGLNRDVASPTLQQAYEQRARQEGVQPLAPRTLHKYLTTLTLRGLIRREHAAGTGAWVYSLPARLQN